MIMMRRLRFFAATPVRGTSIDERLGVKPAGRTIVWSCSVFGLESRFVNQNKGRTCRRWMHRGCRRSQSASIAMPISAPKTAASQKEFAVRFSRRSNRG